MKYTLFEDNLFAIGVPSIDLQHRKLISLFENLIDEMKQAKGSLIIGNILKELTEYTDYHFVEEEKIMEQINFPDIKEHKEEHLYFVNKIKFLNDQFLQKDLDVVIEVADFLFSWLKNHILYSDKKIAFYIKK